MRTIVLILIIISGLCGCKQQVTQAHTKEITEQEVAILTARCVYALENKRDAGSDFNFVETIGQLCKGLGMKSKKPIDFSTDLEELLSSTTMNSILYEFVGKDSLCVRVVAIDGIADGEKVLGSIISIFNPLQYGNVVPKRYKDAIEEEWRKQGWYSSYFG